MRYTLLFGGIVVSAGLLVFFWAWCYAERRLWLRASSSSTGGSADIDPRPLLTEQYQQDDDADPADTVEAQQLSENPTLSTATTPVFTPTSPVLSLGNSNVEAEDGPETSIRIPAQIHQQEDQQRR